MRNWNNQTNISTIIHWLRLGFVCFSKWSNLWIILYSFRTFNQQYNLHSLKNWANIAKICTGWISRYSRTHLETTISTHSSNIWPTSDTPWVTRVHLTVQPSLSMTRSSLPEDIWNRTHCQQRSLCKLNETLVDAISTHLPTVSHWHSYCRNPRCTWLKSLGVHRRSFEPSVACNEIEALVH